MTGILNHPKMPVVAGSLALALLAGGVYSSLDQGNSVSASVRKVNEAARSAFAASAVKPIPTTDVPASTASANQGPVSAASDTSAQQQRPVAPVSPSQPASSVVPLGTKVPPKADNQGVTAPVQGAQVAAAQPAPPEPARLIVEPVMPKTPSDTASASVTPVAVVVPPVAKVTIPDTPQQAAPENQVQAAPQQQAPVVQSHIQVQSAKAAHAVEPRKKKKHRVVRQDEDDSGSSGTPAREEAVTSGKSRPAESDFTEIKGTATSQTLAPAAQPAPVVRKQVDESFKPSVVALAGGQAWVKISPERTIAVKSGDSVPGLGKVTAVTGTSIETEKGKFSLYSKE